MGRSNELTALRQQLSNHYAQAITWGGIKITQVGVWWERIELRSPDSVSLKIEFNEILNRYELRGHDGSIKTIHLADPQCFQFICEWIDASRH